MDEKKIREAIEYLSAYPYLLSCLDDTEISEEWRKTAENHMVAIEALEKQLEKLEKTLREFFSDGKKKDLSVTYCSKRHICLVEFIGHDLNYTKRFENIEPDKIDFNEMIAETIKELKQS